MDVYLNIAAASTVGRCVACARTLVRRYVSLIGGRDARGDGWKCESCRARHVALVSASGVNVVDWNDERAPEGAR